MPEEKPMSPVDGGTSPYLQRPLRSHEKAQRDRENLGGSIRCRGYEAPSNRLISPVALWGSSPDHAEGIEAMLSPVSYSHRETCRISGIRNLSGLGPAGDPPTAASSVRQTFARGKTLFSEGHQADNVYEVALGTLRLHELLKDGRGRSRHFPLQARSSASRATVSTCIARRP